jgi:hypothetical protein
MKKNLVTLMLAAVGPSSAQEQVWNRCIQPMGLGTFRATPSPI